MANSDLFRNFDIFPGLMTLSPTYSPHSTPRKLSPLLLNLPTCHTPFFHSPSHLNAIFSQFQLSVFSLNHARDPLLWEQPRTVSLTPASPLSSSPKCLNPSQGLVPERSFSPLAYDPFPTLVDLQVIISFSGGQRLHPTQKAENNRCSLSQLPLNQEVVV